MLRYYGNAIGCIGHATKETPNMSQYVTPRLWNCQFHELPYFRAQFTNWADLHVAQFMKWAISQTECNIYAFQKFHRKTPTYVINTVFFLLSESVVYRKLIVDRTT
jgi:hypothetical protein